MTTAPFEFPESQRPTALVTGFEPFGGFSINPSAEIVQRLHGETVAGFTIEGRILPVIYGGLEGRIRALLADVRPALVLCLGLAPGATTLRLERIAVNIADFDIADNAGERCVGSEIVTGGPAALLATLPLARIEERLLEAGIAAQLSASAGTYLCNATLYSFLRAIGESAPTMPCGFIHLPYLPAQVAAMLDAARRGERRLEPRELGSMGLDAMLAAVRIALEASR